MRLAEENLGSELSEIRQRKEGYMSRLAHAVAHLTQAGISLQRWKDQVNQRQHNLSGAKSKTWAGLSPDTSQALRNTLLGVPSSDVEQVSGPDVTAVRPRPDADDHIEEGSRTAPQASVKDSHKSRKENDE